MLEHLALHLQAPLDSDLVEGLFFASEITEKVGWNGGYFMKNCVAMKMLAAMIATIEHY